MKFGWQEGADVIDRVLIAAKKFEARHRHESGHSTAPGTLSGFGDIARHCVLHRNECLSTVCEFLEQRDRLPRPGLDMVDLAGRRSFLDEREDLLLGS